MKTLSCKRLFEYWNERRGSRSAPERGEIEPGAIRHLLADTFVLVVDAEAGYSMRLAGTRVCALFCREIKGASFVDLFAETNRSDLRGLVDIVSRELTPVVAGVTAEPQTDLPPASLELMLLPLYHHGHRHARMLGMLVPVVVPYWLGTGTTRELSLTSLRHLHPVTAPGLVPSQPAAVRIRRNWAVLDGGRS